MVLFLGVSYLGMEQRTCACRGVRSCLLCERPTEAVERSKGSTTVFFQCHICSAIVKEELTEPDSDDSLFFVCSGGCCAQEKKVINTAKEETRSKGFLNGAVFEGVTVVKDFISREEERDIASQIDAHQWAESQSGRRKQDYGPKVNFKRQKVKLGSFNGLPPFSKQLVRRMQCEIEWLRDFTPVELCNLDYSPDRGSAIDPHKDDDWLWGERLVTLNLLSHTYLSFTNAGSIKPPCEPLTSKLQPPTVLEICVPLPQRSLVIVQGAARYQWQHSIHRRHILSRRIATTLREVTVDFMPGGKLYDSTGKDILEVASSYQGTPVNFR